MAARGVTTGQAARSAGVTRKAIRVYEAKGLLPAPGRTDSGYRLFSPEEVERLVFIRRARMLGLRLDEIRAVLDVSADGTSPCGTVRALLDARISEIDATVAELLALRETLDARRARTADVGEAAICAIIETDS